jgi:L-seryl-tRNA(Ser) seleniumtransferase
MAETEPSPLASIPSIDRLLSSPALAETIRAHGRAVVLEAAREVLDEVRAALRGNGEAAADLAEESAIGAAVAERVAARLAPSLKPVFNLTGTVLHTNLGRAPMAPEAIEAAARVAAGASNLEFDLDKGRRGDRDSHLEDWLVRLTGAEAATVVNNNAAAVMLVLNTLALRKEVPVSRGELIEIGGAFRIPDIMSRSGAKLVEVGTTNRTHLKDFEAAVGPRTGLIMKVHTSNYAIQGFTAEVAERDLAALCKAHGIPFAVDLGSGTLVDLAAYGLPHEPTAAETIAAGADVVTFSGDKLLGGPQAGLIVGRADLIGRIKKNPMKRALRVDKMTIAALAATFAIYADPDRLTQRLPTLGQLARPLGDIAAAAERIAPRIAERLGAGWTVATAECMSQIGSGALPVESLPSRAVLMAPATPAKRGTGTALKRLAAAFAKLPRPVIGRIQDDRIVLDLRCLDDEAAFVAQLAQLETGAR